MSNTKEYLISVLEINYPPLKDSLWWHELISLIPEKRGKGIKKAKWATDDNMSDAFYNGRLYSKRPSEYPNGTQWLKEYKARLSQYPEDFGSNH